jgi:hypothetical protein
MGVEVRPEFRPRVPHLIYRAEGKALADYLRPIYKFSKKRGIRSITDFLDNRDHPDEDIDYDEWKAARSDWYAPAEGLQAIQVLVDAIQSDPKVARRWEDLETLLDDLQELARCLEGAASHGAQFRLDVE